MILTDISFGSGFALEWGSHGLISADHDGKIGLWRNIEEPPLILQSPDSVEDAKFADYNTFLTVGDNGNMMIWDARSSKVESVVPVSTQEVYCVAVNP